MYDPARDIFTSSEDAPDDESAEPNNNRAENTQQAGFIEGVPDTDNNIRKHSNNALDPSVTVCVAYICRLEQTLADAL